MAGGELCTTGILEATPRLEVFQTGSVPDWKSQTGIAKNLTGHAKTKKLQTGSTKNLGGHAQTGNVPDWKRQESQRPCPDCKHSRLKIQTGSAKNLIGHAKTEVFQTGSSRVESPRISEAMPRLEVFHTGSSRLEVPTISKVVPRLEVFPCYLIDSAVCSFVLSSYKRFERTQMQTCEPVLKGH